ncbi:hypothetical protein GCM10025867_41650 [Frondihabitans sucicola]|uniref:DUF559 domain-containing protein n=1 Tax=Frondihabitans sucicola TaxID=1268041 RepID=A0ABM8GUB3_9MICO|nr:hypothetical protein GCM10025867_41650 [Frondihabitans sucicola]
MRSGAFVERSAWEALDGTQRYRLLVRAAVPSLGARLVVSHESALALHGRSLLRAWPADVHVTDARRERGQAWAGVVKHAAALTPDDLVVIDGTMATSLTRTCVDIALTRGFDVAVACADECLRRTPTSTPLLLAKLAERPHARGRIAAAAAALSFASGLSDSGGESWCRCRLHELGAPVPVLQQSFWDRQGRIGSVDFWFEEHGVIVEFDGDQKYLASRYANGRSASEVVLHERRRERRLLAVPAVRTVVRVDWSDLVAPWRLRVLLVDSGLPVR